MKKYKAEWSVVVQVDDWNVEIQQNPLFPEDGYIIEANSEEEAANKAYDLWNSFSEDECMKLLMRTTKEDLLSLYDGEVGEDGKPITEIDELEMNNIIFIEDVETGSRTCL